MRLKWDGRTDDGTRAPDGRYRYRITLQHKGRSVVLASSVRIDTTPPHPRVTSIGPRHEFGARAAADAGGRRRRRPPARAGDQARSSGCSRPGRGPTRLVLQDKRCPTARRSGAGTGSRRAGARSRPGTYLVAIETRDEAGNRGLSPPLNRRGLPATSYGAKLPGHGGHHRALPRRAAAQRRHAGGRPGRVLRRRRGASRGRGRCAASGRARRRPAAARRPRAVRLHAPGRESGVYLLSVRTATRSTTVPFAVQSAEAPRGPRRPAGDDLAGAQLARRRRRRPAQRARPRRRRQALSRLRRRRPARRLRHARRRRCWRGWTAAATATTSPPTSRSPRGAARSLEDHKGVILPSDVRWLPRALQQRLRRYVRDGGTVATLRHRLAAPPGVAHAPRADDRSHPARDDRRLRRAPAPAASACPSRATSSPPTTRSTSSPARRAPSGPSRSCQEADLDRRPPPARSPRTPRPGGPSSPRRAWARASCSASACPSSAAHLSARANDPNTAALLDRTWTLLSH